MTTPQINAQRKAELLSTTVEHIDITSFDARTIIDAMGKMSFTSRDLARATGIYNQMLEDPDCSIFLVIAGSTSAGGCMDLYAELLRSNMIDGIVATGATIVDMDFFEGLGHKHYQALEVPDDDTLRSLLIDSFSTLIIRSSKSPKRWNLVPIRAARSSAKWANISSSMARRTTALSN
jgi:deoxyhypusine synthase